MKDVVIVANFAGNLEGTDNNRFSYLAQLLSNASNVELITSDFEHKSKTKRTHVSEEYEFKITLLEELPYPKNICIQRFVSHASLGKNITKYLEKRKKPDVIYCAVPSLDVAWAAAKYSRDNGVRYIIDIQDLWPEAFKMVFRLPIISDLIFVPMKKIANKVYKQADEIVAVSETYCRRALEVNKKCKMTHTVFLGTDLAVFDKNVKQDYNINWDDKNLKLAYCGTLGSSYDITCVIDALAILRCREIQVPQFIVMGDGPRKSEFESYAKEKNVDVIFTGRLEYAKMCSLLCKCDMVVNPIVAGSAASIINKHADYAASGLPVLNTQESVEYQKLVEQYDMGVNCINGSAADLAEKLQYFIQDKTLRLRMGANARKCAEEKFDRKSAYIELVNIILEQS